VVKSGVFFVGLPSCKKRGQGTEHVPQTCRPYIPLLKNLIASTADRAFPSFWPRLSANVGHATTWHSDGNTRGGHPNAHRALDPGGWIRICKAIEFRCSMLLWEGKYVVPWDLDSTHFRYMEWTEGVATIQEAPTVTYCRVHALGGGKHRTISERL